MLVMSGRFGFGLVAVFLRTKHHTSSTDEVGASKVRSLVFLAHIKQMANLGHQQWAPGVRQIPALHMGPRHIHLHQDTTMSTHIRLTELCMIQQGHLHVLPSAEAPGSRDQMTDGTTPSHDLLTFPLVHKYHLAPKLVVIHLVAVVELVRT